MASYQVPQFLDSGDKILGPLNMRQFGYAMFGFLFCVIIYGLISSVAPSLGIYAFIPCLPFAAIFAYIALGQFNGRDAEIYVFRYMLYTLKPRQMVYSRVPFDSDLQLKEAELTFPKILSRWKEESAQHAITSINEFHRFDDQDTSVRTQKIRDLGSMIDANLTNTRQGIRTKEIEIARNEALIRMSSPQNKTSDSRNSAHQLPVGLIPKRVVPNSQTRTWQQGENYFDKDESSSEL